MTHKLYCKIVYLFVELYTVAEMYVCFFFELFQYSVLRCLILKFGAFSFKNEKRNNVISDFIAMDDSGR